MVSENIGKLKERICSVCSRVNRDPSSITIVAVSKGRPLEQVREAIDAGINDIGENRVQEAVEKFSRLPATGYRLRTHLVGHLQTNKVKDSLKLFNLIHSVDSSRLAQEIDRQAAGTNKVQEVLIEVNTSGEKFKFGLKPDEFIEVTKEISKFKNINIKGLMTVAPVVDNPEKARPYFKILRELRKKICELWSVDSGLWILSMGMTDDFEVAIEEGATMVRIGRAIFD